MEPGGFVWPKAELRVADMRLKGEVADSMSAVETSGARQRCTSQNDAGVISNWRVLKFKMHYVLALGRAITTFIGSS
jgi:hypothetical protein